MLVSTALLLFFIGWSSAFLLDYFLRLKNYRPYLDVADKYGLHVSLFQLRFYTSRSKDVDHYLQSPRAYVDVFYSIGALVAVIAQVGITIYLSVLLFSDIGSFFAKPSAPVLTPPPSTSSLQPAPPPAPIPIFMVVLIVCAVIHELGHAWCARSKGVAVNGFGIFVLGIYPGAFTDIDTNSLNLASPWHRMQIYSAGVWHNLVMALLAYLLFANSTVLLAPGFRAGEGVMITDVDPSSGLYGAGGLQFGDVVRAIDDCEVRSSSSWTSCIRYRQHAIDGKCVSAERVRAGAGSPIHCCPNATVSHLCFETNVLAPRMNQTEPVTKAAPLVELAGGVIVVGRKEEYEQREIYTCLHARETLEGQSCNTTESCSTKGERCVYPALFNGTRLVSLTVAGKGRPVIFVGSFAELKYLVSFTELTPRFPLLFPSFISPAWVPLTVDQLAKYLLAFSLALGLLNALPCFALDGQFIVYTVVHTYLRTRLPKKRRSSLIRLLLCYGTLILVGNITIGFYRLYRTYTTG
ncbi:hypothetical protein PRIPAC_92586 [Pristionchus pacificus]|uniref:Membrane-bound transcription factor site-2 protease n=1 Tax=Pristionchus pacificus TaxID=54126 RepID=A0A2A6CDX9_PRIPA|nr:hypothetical protein PRIPAC_92586 [Pristionchus pacificus]|eukprot:PDM76288.1 Peptidase [Pristionchus pacificus]